MSVITAPRTRPPAAAEPSAPRSNRKTAKRREALTAAVFLAPDVLGLLVFVAVPMALSIAMGFFQISGFGDYKFIGLDNYRRMMSDPLFWDSLRVTGIYVVCLVPLIFCVSLGLGLLIKQKLPAVGAFRTAFFIPYAVSLVVVGLVWEFMLEEQTGVVNRTLRNLGFEGESWLGDPALALGTVVAIGVWVQMGYYMIIFLAGLQDIPQEYYDAALIDGAGPWTTFRRITWPLLRPTSFFVLLMSTVAAVTGGLELIFVLTDGGPANATSLAVFYIYQQAFRFGEFGYASAMGSFLVLIMVAFTAVLFAVTRGGRFDDGD